MTVTRAQTLACVYRAYVNGMRHRLKKKVQEPQQAIDQDLLRFVRLYARILADGYFGGTGASRYKV